MLEQIERVARRAGEIFLNAGTEKFVSYKSSNKDMVTAYDKRVQEFLYDELSRIIPEASFLGEEGLDTPQETPEGGRFIIDPIDGTTNFVRGMNASVVSICYEVDNKAKYAVIFNPYTNELFSAEAGYGSKLNGDPIAVSEKTIDQALVCVGAAPYDPDLKDITLDYLKEMMDVCIDYRRSGSAAYDMCLVAAGRVDIMYECKLRPWDFSAAALIIQEAGGEATDMQGNLLPFDASSSVLVGNKSCYKSAFDIINK